LIRASMFPAPAFLRTLLAVLLVCFGMLAGFSPLLHNHDFDLSDGHQDCAACQWAQSPTSLETAPSSLLFYPVVAGVSPTRSQLSLLQALFLLANRGPPFSF